MKPVLSTEEVVRLEDIIEREGTSKAELMELAGEFAANEILKLNPDRVLVLVGFGNNGGDGWVAADILTHKGVDVDIVSPVEPDEIPAALARHVARRTAGRDVHVCVGPSRDELEVLIDKADVVVDVPVFMVIFVRRFQSGSPRSMKMPIALSPSMFLRA